MYILYELVVSIVELLRAKLANTWVAKPAVAPVLSPVLPTLSTIYMFTPRLTELSLPPAPSVSVVFHRLPTQKSKYHSSGTDCS